MKYVCGFMFDPDRNNVVLIRKTKPTWQAGKLNGVGGKIEPMEEPYCAMVREFQEETGVETTRDDWEHFCTISGEDWVVLFFRSFHDISDVTTMEEEEIEIHPITISDRVIENLKVLLPLALDQSGIAIPVYLNDITS